MGGPPPGYPGYPVQPGQPYPGYPGYPIDPSHPAAAPPPAPPAWQPLSPGSVQPSPPRRRGRLIAIVTAVLVVGIGIIAAVLLTRSAGPVTADEQALVGKCVNVNNLAVTVVDCGSAHDATITTVVEHYTDCPSGTSAFRIHPDSSNDHSGCYKPG